MNRRFVLRAIAVVVLCGVLLIPIQSVLAGWSYWTYADGTDVPIDGGWTYYDRQREVWYSPYGIWFQKYDGPAMDAAYWNCGYGGPNGVIQDVSNSDPAPGVYLKNNGSAPSYLLFCLAFRNDNNNYDTFTGALNWDGSFP